MRFIGFRYEDDETYDKLKTHCIKKKITMEKFFKQYIEKTVASIDGTDNGLERFFDSNYIPKPSIDEQDMDNKVVPWLRTLDTEKLGKMKAATHQTYVFAAALRDLEPIKRHSEELPYSILWKRYSW